MKNYRKELTIEIRRLRSIVNALEAYIDSGFGGEEVAEHLDIYREWYFDAIEQRKALP